MRKLKPGDYVLATKYFDGDPGDHFAVGLLDRIEISINGTRYFIIDSNGNQFRANGFARCEKIQKARGKWLVDRFNEIERSSQSVWWWKKQPMKNQLLTTATGGQGE